MFILCFLSHYLCHPYSPYCSPHFIHFIPWPITSAFWKPSRRPAAPFAGRTPKAERWSLARREVHGVHGTFFLGTMLCQIQWFFFGICEIYNFVGSKVLCLLSSTRSCHDTAFLATSFSMFLAARDDNWTWINWAKHQHKERLKLIWMIEAAWNSDFHTFCGEFTWQKVEIQQTIVQKQSKMHPLKPNGPNLRNDHIHSYHLEYFSGSRIISCDIMFRVLCYSPKINHHQFHHQIRWLWRRLAEGESCKGSSTSKEVACAPQTWRCLDCSCISPFSLLNNNVQKHHS